MKGSKLNLIKTLKLICCFGAFIISSGSWATKLNRKNVDSLIRKKCCLGWREWVKLPHLFKDKVLAKIDSGAKTSSLHAENIRIYDKNNEEWVKFTVQPKRNSKEIAYHLDAKIIETKNIRSSNGKVSIRPVILTKIELGGESWDIELTLVDRDVMGYRMLLGRTAFQSKFLLDSEKSFLQTVKKDFNPDNEKKESVFVKRMKTYGILKGSRNANIIETLIVFLILFGVRKYILISVKNRRKDDFTSKKRLEVLTRNIAVFIFLVAVLVIWLNEFKSISLYFMAISVATVLMMKEMLKNFHGWFLLTGSRSFKIGDKIKIKQVLGEVIDLNFMSIKIAEIESKSASWKLSGNIITMPNSIFLNASVTNISKIPKYIFHTITYSIKEESDWKKREKIFNQAALEIFSEYENDAKDYFKTRNDTRSKLSLEIQPKIYFTFSSPEKINISIKMVILSNKKHEIESRLVKLYLESIEV